MQEKWIRWEPTNNLAKKYYVKSILDDLEDGLQISLIDENSPKNNIVLKFPHSVSAYRRTNETFTLTTINYLNKVYGGEFYSQWTFFKVENSEYLRWIAEKSFGIAEPPYYNFTHFCILTSDLIIDIATTTEAIVSKV